MANESFANTLLVEVAGNPLPADIAALLTHAYVDDSRNLPDMFVLRFRDPQLIVLAKAGLTIGTKVTLKVQTAEPGGPRTLIAGEVTAVELDLDRAGTVTEVRGLDPAHRLFRGRRVAAYPDMTLADVVRKVVERAGIPVGTIDAVPGVGGQKDTQLSQRNVSDWEFLSEQADLVGAQLSIVDGKVNFRLPAPPSGAPDSNAVSTTDPLVLEAHRNLVALHAAVSSAGQVPSVEARGWDVQHKQEVTATATPRVAGNDVPGAAPVELANKFNAPPLLAADPAWGTPGVVKAVAAALGDQLGAACVELEGVAKGNPELRAGAAVALANVGEPFAGKYTLTSTRHLFSPDAGYTTAFTVSGRQERSLYGLTAGGDGPGRVEATAGLVPAIVSDVRDPQKLGRVKLTFPWLAKDFVTGWARVAQPGAGKQRGALILPEVGDEVVVGFAHGDVDWPYVLGGLHNGKDPVPTLSTEPVDSGSGEIAVRGFVSRKGHTLEFIEDGGITVKTGDGKLSVRLDAKKGTVEIKGDTAVEVAAKKVAVKGSNGVTVDAGSGALELKGRSVAVTGQTDMKLTASGQVTVSGTPIKLN